FFLSPVRATRRAPPSFPTRRSSDLSCRPLWHEADADGCLFQLRRPPRRLRPAPLSQGGAETGAGDNCPALPAHERGPARSALHRDRKSTRLNSSHVKISYAVFCLKK